MLQTQQKSGFPNDACVNGVGPKTDKQAEIVKKLEDLNKWQEEQKKLLNLRQAMQRQMLGLEQKTMYKALGLQQQSGSESPLMEEQMYNKQQNDDLIENGEYSKESIGTSPLEEEIKEDGVNMGPIPCWDKGNFKDASGTKPKKPFLKRGEGLKQRFKIDPDEFRLNNLPKYKFANAHPNLRPKPTKKSNKTDLKTKSAFFPISNAKTLDHDRNLDVQEQQFQNLLISSKVTCSSTPETKSSATTEKNNAAGCGKRNVQNYDTPLAQVIAWSKILDPLEVEPLQVARCGKPTIPQTEESIFELLEQKAQEGSFDMNSTCLKEFMARGNAQKLNESDDIIPVEEHVKNQRLEPVALAEKLPQDDICGYSDEVENTTSDDTTHKTIEETTSTLNKHSPQVRVTFSDSNETHEYGEQPDMTVEESTRLSAGVDQPNDLGDTSKNELFLQFKQALFAALQDKEDQYVANDSTLNSVSDTTLTDDKIISNCNISSNSIYTPACLELQEKTETLKKRLADLEKEIKFFKENNLLLLKAKQEHELQKSIYAQEHLEAMESLKDEKIRMEIYLHDERVKLEDEKRQFEQNVKLKNQGVIAKERKECERLREQVHQLELQLKTKENNHTAAQARLRTQIRNLEREQSKLYEQIENLTKENKRLELENVKISREQNNKILLEINRNIAKLAPKQVQEAAFPILDDGPPTLRACRTVSKSIVSTATANNKCAKPHKTTTATRPSNAQQRSNCKKQTSNKDQETRTDRVTKVVEENKQPQEIQQHNVSLDEIEDDDEDDILKEFQSTSEKSNKTPPKKIETYNNNSAPEKSLTKNESPEPTPSSPRSCAAHMKREIVNVDGSKDIWYPNGNLKKISADGLLIRMLYYNKDIKETDVNEGTVKYYYAATNTWHTTYLDGLEILEFPNGQVEHRHKNGLVEVHYPNNSVKIIHPYDPKKLEEWRFSDGTHLLQLRNGDKILSLPNGQKEIHNKLHKRREYPDGTVKIVYPDGSIETRYSNGRVRLKDKEGILVMDTDMAN